MAGEEAIVHAGEAFLRAFHRAHPAEMAECFAEDGQFLLAYGRSIQGRQAIQAFWQGVLDTASFAMERTILEIQLSRDWAYETGTYSFRGSQHTLLDQGRYVVIWKQIDGEWKRHREIWNSGPTS